MSHLKAEKPSYSITVRTLSGQPIELTVNGDMTVKDVKTILANDFKIGGVVILVRQQNWKCLKY
jgi:hypothetical protein